LLSGVLNNSQAWFLHAKTLCSGLWSAVEPTLSIPNRVLKRRSADDTALATKWDNRSRPEHRVFFVPIFYLNSYDIVRYYFLFILEKECMATSQLESRRIGDSQVKKSINPETKTEVLQLSTKTSLAMLVAIMLDKQSNWFKNEGGTLVVTPQEVQAVYQLLIAQPWQFDGFYTSSAEGARAITIATVAQLVEFASSEEVLQTA
jgi:hypothetical protein